MESGGKRQRLSPQDTDQVYASLGCAASSIANGMSLSSVGGKWARLVGMYFGKDFFHMIKQGKVCAHPECTDFLATSVSRLSCAASSGDVETVLADVFVYISYSLAGSAFLSSTLVCEANKVATRRCRCRHE
jgi:hypothetical protein